MNTATNAIADVRELTGDELAQVSGGLCPIIIDELVIHVNVEPPPKK